MIRKIRTREELNIAAGVAKSTVLLQIQPKQILLESRLRTTDIKGCALAAVIDHTDGTFVIRDDNTLDVEIAASVHFYRNSNGAPDEVSPAGRPDWVAKIAMEFILTYGVPAVPVPEEVRERGLPAFVKITALSTAWPYLRHEAMHMASQLGIPFIMPMLVQDVGDVDSQKTGSGKK